MRGLPITAADVIAVFEGAWSSEGFYSREHEELRLEEGRESLRRFVAREDASRATPLAIERDFKFRLGASDVVTGRWDRIDEAREGIVLVDYKTARIASQEKADERARASARGEQLGLYALAYHEVHGVTPARVELHFVGDGLRGSAAVEPEHMERAREKALEAAAGIRAAHFAPKPDPRTCGRCPYSRFCPHSVARGAS
jgi:DNA helicase-2/ATP-dependent DNA helicase PcrA